MGPRGFERWFDASGAFDDRVINPRQPELTVFANRSPISECYEGWKEPRLLQHSRGLEKDLGPAQIAPLLAEGSQEMPNDATLPRLGEALDSLGPRRGVR